MNHVRRAFESSSPGSSRARFELIEEKPRRKTTPIDAETQTQMPELESEILHPKKELKRKIENRYRSSLNIPNALPIPSSPSHISPTRTVDVEHHSYPSVVPFEPPPSSISSTPSFHPYYISLSYHHHHHPSEPPGSLVPHIRKQPSQSLHHTTATS